MGYLLNDDDYAPDVNVLADEYWREHEAGADTDLCPVCGFVLEYSANHNSYFCAECGADYIRDELPFTDCNPDGTPQ